MLQREPSDRTGRAHFCPIALPPGRARRRRTCGREVVHRIGRAGCGHRLSIAGVARGDVVADGLLPLLRCGSPAGLGVVHRDLPGLAWSRFSSSSPAPARAAGQVTRPRGPVAWNTACPGNSKPPGRPAARVLRPDQPLQGGKPGHCGAPIREQRGRCQTAWPSRVPAIQPASVPAFTASRSGRRPR